MTDDKQRKAPMGRYFRFGVLMCALCSLEQGATAQVKGDLSRQQFTMPPPAAPVVGTASINALGDGVAFSNGVPGKASVAAWNVGLAGGSIVLNKSRTDTLQANGATTTVWTEVQPYVSGPAGKSYRVRFRFTKVVKGTVFVLEGSGTSADCALNMNAAGTTEQSCETTLTMPGPAGTFGGTAAKLRYKDFINNDGQVWITSIDFTNLN
jgi:hypothetical protein